MFEQQVADARRTLGMEPQPASAVGWPVVAGVAAVVSGLLAVIVLVAARMGRSASTETTDRPTRTPAKPKAARRRTLSRTTTSKASTTSKATKATAAKARKPATSEASS